MKICWSLVGGDRDGRIQEMCREVQRGLKMFRVSGGLGRCRKA